MRALFAHPAYPNQFTQIAHTMGQQGEIECCCLVDMGFAQQVQADAVPITYYGYHKDAEPATSGYFYSSNWEEAIRHGKAVVDAITTISKNEPIDLIVGHASFGVTLFIKKLLGLPVISYVELPGYDTAFCRREFPAIREHSFLDVSFKAMVYASVIHSEATIVPSQHAKSLFPPELQPRITVQMEGFHTPPLDRDKQALRESLGLPQYGPIIGFAGRTLEAVRGFDTFVQVAANLNKARADVHFLVIGNEQTIYGNEQAYLGQKSFKQYALERASLEENVFIFRGQVTHDDLLRHFAAMDLILFPLFEGASHWSLFEAMASGLTILASNCCFVPEVITHGREGYLFDPEDVRAFTEKCLEIMADPEAFAHLGRNARKRIETCYSPDQAVEGYRRIIQSVMHT